MPVGFVLLAANQPVFVLFTELGELLPKCLFVDFGAFGFGRLSCLFLGSFGLSSVEACLLSRSLEGGLSVLSHKRSSVKE